MNKDQISLTGRVIIALAAVLLFIAIFVPIWRIELDAPQYPEGLAMLIYANKLGGDVEIINGLNHYIGMQTLHAENFIEFTVLPYIVGGFTLLILLTAFIGRKKILNFSFGSFALFGVIAMVDFWRWEYNYGHNLDPTAAIIVPGMAYQPPLIGYKQLLNFGAFSIPDIGGILFIICGILLLMVVLLERGLLNKFLKKGHKLGSVAAISILLMSCSQIGPEPIRLNKDNCDYCKMTITDGRFGAEVITDKGRIYKFDDLSCLLRYTKQNKKQSYTQTYVHNYSTSNVLMDATTAFYLYSEEVKSPMHGDMAAFETKAAAEKYAQKWNKEILLWADIKAIE
jgi:copper chaperone NosL